MDVNGDACGQAPRHVPESPSGCSNQGPSGCGP